MTPAKAGDVYAWWLGLCLQVILDSQGALRVAAVSVAGCKARLHDHRLRVTRGLCLDTPDLTTSVPFPTTHPCPMAFDQCEETRRRQGKGML